MTQHIPAKKRPAWDPGANPVRLKCPGHHVYGWAYPDGTLELICDRALCQQQRGKETRHLFNPTTGEHFPVYVKKS